jgi:ribonuclease MRP protein subunit RMP1
MGVHVFPSIAAIEVLRLELSLLHVLHHRNRNQHHLQPFFKHLAVLKRTLSHLLEHIESEYLVQKLRTTVIPAFWEEVSRVVARGEFVALGLVLCASVARIGCSLGGIVDSNGAIVFRPKDSGIHVEDDDLGEIVRRENFGDAV